MTKYLFLIFLFIPFDAPSQSKSNDYTPKGARQDSSASMLLLDRGLQAELVDAIDYMYNFKFEEAEKEFRWLKYRYPNNPLPYFVMGLNEWWKIVPNTEDKNHDALFIAYMDSTIQKAYTMYRKDPKDIEAAFFLAGAYGFKGRIYSERRKWTKATIAGKNALKYLRRGKGVNELSPEFLFGDALYNYYSVWIPENYPALRPIMAFFKKGDKDLGLKQLDEVSRFAFYTRVEAQYFLMRIYTNEENKTYLAQKICTELYNQYPDNAYFHRFYAMLNFSRGRLSECEKTSKVLLDRVEQKQVGYEATSGRYASYYLGYVNRVRGKHPTAKAYFEQTVQYAEAIEAYDSGYYISALKYLAKYAKDEKDYATAKKYYQKIAKHSEKKKSRKDARKQLKKIKKNKFDENY
ncbi:MAG: tetratricopeptide repeat protein [Thermonemataceae bacterium]